MHRFFIFEKQNDFKNKIIPNKNLFHQIKKVLRIKQNENFICIYENFELTCNFINDEIIVKNINKFFIENKFKLTLIQATTKNNKISLIIQKAVELGVDEIILWQSKRSISKIEDFILKKERYEKIIIEACEQSRRNDIPLINFVKKIKEMNIKNDAIVLYEYEKETYIKNFINSYNKNNLKIIIGPEGGIENEELKEFKLMGAIPVSLGKNILRTETASIYSISIINYEKK